MVGEVGNQRKVEVGWAGKWPTEEEDAKADGQCWHKMAEPGVSGPQVWKDGKKCSLTWQVREAYLFGM